MTEHDREMTVYDVAEIEQTASDLLSVHGMPAGTLYSLIVCFPLVRRALLNGMLTSWDVDEELARQARYCLSALNRLLRAA